MDLNRFTEKAQEALAGSQQLAVRLGHQQVDVEHLLLSLLDQEQGLTSAILTKAQIPVDALKLRVHRELEKLPRDSGPSGEPEQVHVSPRLNRVLVQAQDEGKRVTDDYVWVEHRLPAGSGDQQAAGRVSSEFA